MTQRCDCCDLPIESCGKAIENRRRAEAFLDRTRLLAKPGWFAAGYAGTCSDCGEHFDEGQPIHRARDGWSCCEAAA